MTRHRYFDRLWNKTRWKNKMVTNKPRVLIVDDEPVICELLTEDLEELGYLCKTAPDGDNALRELADNKFDVILLDIRLPGISGIELLKMIKLKYNSAVIMITAIDDVNTAVISMKLGALDYIVKPFSLDVLRASINSALEKIDKSKLSSSKVLDLSSTEKALQEMDAIANGIEVKLDFTDKRSSIVLQKTMQVARELDISEETIKEWEEKRAEKDRKNLQVLKKFNKNVSAQIIMGVTEEYQINGNSNRSDN